MKPVLVAPSLPAADFRRLGEEVRAVDAAGAVEAGANAVVAGPAIFGARDHAAAIVAIREGRCPPAGRIRS